MSLNLPERTGEKPKTHYGIPHQQKDQNPEPELHQRMTERFLALPGTVIGASLISVPGARALFLPDSVGCNCDAFFKGREFAHIHPEYDGSFHMTLSEADCEAVLEKGWGELHPLTASGEMPQRVVMVYAPRNDEEVDVVMHIAAAAYRFARTPV